MLVTVMTMKDAATELDKFSAVPGRVDEVSASVLRVLPLPSRDSIPAANFLLP